MSHDRSLSFGDCRFPLNDDGVLDPAGPSMILPLRTNSLTSFVCLESPTRSTFVRSKIFSSL